MEDLALTNDNGYGGSYNVTEAVRRVASEAEEAEDRIDTLAMMVAVLVEKLPADEVLEVLNAASRRTWRVA